MELLIQLLATLNSMTPLAVIALLGLVIFLQVKNQKKIGKIEDNDLHDLPEMAETLQRIEVMLSKEFSYIRERLSGRKDLNG